jgi:hypothetical protein
MDLEKKKQQISMLKHNTRSFYANGKERGVEWLASPTSTW